MTYLDKLEPIWTRKAAGVSRGFGNITVSASFNEAATRYNKVPGNIKEALSIKVLKKLIKDWVKKNIAL